MNEMATPSGRILNHLAELAEQNGVIVYTDMPAVELIQNTEGAVEE